MQEENKDHNLCSNLQRAALSLQLYMHDIILNEIYIKNTAVVFFSGRSTIYQYVMNAKGQFTKHSYNLWIESEDSLRNQIALTVILPLHLIFQEIRQSKHFKQNKNSSDCTIWIVESDE